MNNFYNQPIMPQLQRYEIIHVNGENGARAMQMLPGSSVLLLDDTAPVVWLAQTDGAGYKTIKPFKITPYEPEPAPQYNELLERIKKLEETINDKSNYQSNRSKQNRTNNGNQENA